MADSGTETMVFGRGTRLVLNTLCSGQSFSCRVQGIVTMSLRMHKKFAAGLTCTALVLHVYFCDWRMSTFPSQRAILGFEDCPLGSFGAFTFERSNAATHPEIASSFSNVPTGATAVHMHYACGLAAADGYRVRTAIIMGLLLPAGLSCAALDRLMVHKRRPPSARDDGFRLSRGHYTAC
jgi:hypothetical protein